MQKKTVSPWASETHTAAYDKLNIFFPYTQSVKKIVSEAIAHLPTASSEHPITILDLATGTGNIAYGLARTLHAYPTSCSVLATDNDCRMLSQAVHKSSAQEIQFIQADLTQENCGLSAAYLGTIDLITMANALFLFSKEIKKTVLENIYKLLKPDGVLILSEPTNMNTSNPTPMLVNHALHRDILRLALNAPAVISISKENRRLNETTVIQPKEELIELLRPAGFFVEKAGETYAARNTLFVCTKTIPERDAIDISDRHIVLLPFVLTLLLRLGLITLALALISFLSHR